jgi:SWI/SNF-related matrix-associated actin-dependent regulator 1 of chromatin subfamily A
MKLFQQQIEGAAWLASRRRGYLGDAPGLGKTRTGLHALQMPGMGEQRPLVVCPAAVCTHWQREAAALGVALGVPQVFSYEAITRGGYLLMREVLQWRPTTLFLDEAHYLKHAESQRTQILLGKDGYARRIERVYPLSGTPIPRNPREFWTVGAALFPEVMLQYGFHTRAQFEAHFCITRGSLVRGVWREKIVGAKNEEEFCAILSQCMLRRTTTGQDTPAIWYQPLSLDADAVGEANDMWVEEQIAAGVPLAELAGDPHVARYRRKVGELKVPVVIDLLTAQLADSEEQVVIFAQHHTVLHALRTGLAAFGVAYIDGTVSQKKRDDEVRQFAEKRTRVFIGQNQACGTGMDGLQGTCARVILVEPDWTATGNEQLVKRVARVGSSADHVVAQMVALAGTLDDAIVRQNVREAQMQVAMGQAEEA